MRERIYKGCTRPAMLKGVPLRVAVPVGGVLVMVLIWGTWLASRWGYGWVVFTATGLLTVGLYVWASGITASDDQRLLQVWKHMRLQWLHLNRRLWKCRSYSPTVYKGANDAWFR